MKRETNVQIDENEVKVHYWDELETLYGDGFQSYLKAEALLKLNRTQEAIDELTPYAEGTVTRNENGEPEGDSWNWAAWWIACNSN